MKLFWLYGVLWISVMCTWDPNCAVDLFLDHTVRNLCHHFQILSCRRREWSTTAPGLWPPASTWPTWRPIWTFTPRPTSRCINSSLRRHCYRHLPSTASATAVLHDTCHIPSPWPTVLCLTVFSARKPRRVSVPVCCCLECWGLLTVWIYWCSQEFTLFYVRS